MSEQDENWQGPTFTEDQESAEAGEVENDDSQPTTSEQLAEEQGE